MKKVYKWIRRGISVVKVHRRILKSAVLQTYSYIRPWCYVQYVSVNELSSNYIRTSLLLVM